MYAMQLYVRRSASGLTPLAHVFAALIALSFFQVPLQAAGLKTVTEATSFGFLGPPNAPKFESISITPFDSSLGILKKVEVDLNGTTEIVGSVPAGLLPTAVPYGIDVSHRFRGAADELFEFTDFVKASVLAPVIPDVATPVFHRLPFDYEFEFDESTNGIVFPDIKVTPFNPPSEIRGSVEQFVDQNIFTSDITFEELIVPNQPELFVAPIVISTTGVLELEYSYLPFGTDAFVVDNRFPINRRVPPAPWLDPYPKNSEPITMDSQVDDIFNQTAVATGTAEGFELGLYLQDKILDGNMMEAYARASTAYAVTGSETDFIHASFTIDGFATLGGLGDAYIQLLITNGDGDPLAFFNISFDGRSNVPTVSSLQEGCQPNCVDDPQPFLEGGWSGSETIDFFIPASDGVIDAILYGFANNGTGEVATLDFLNTASLEIHPTGDTTVALATGQFFVPIPEPSSMTLIALGLLGLCFASRRREYRQRFKLTERRKKSQLRTLFEPTPSGIVFSPPKRTGCPLRTHERTVGRQTASA